MSAKSAGGLLHRRDGRPILACVVSALIVLLAGASPGAAEPGAGGGRKTGTKAPAFTLTTLQGEVVNGRESAGKKRPILLNFWGIRCQACLEELPRLSDLHGSFGQDVAFYGINVDGIDGDFLRKQMEKTGTTIPYGVVADPEMKLVDIFQMTAAPLTIIIDREGTIRYTHEGFEAGDEEPLKRAIQEVSSAR